MANIAKEEACQSLLLKMRNESLVKFDIHKGRWLIGCQKRGAMLAPLDFQKRLIGYFSLKVRKHFFRVFPSANR
jgi:hypothetical protein